VPAGSYHILVQVTDGGIVNTIDSGQSLKVVAPFLVLSAAATTKRPVYVPGNPAGSAPTRAMFNSTTFSAVPDFINLRPPIGSIYFVGAGPLNRR